MSPVRFQQFRKKRWRMPPNTKSVARPHRFGNSFVIGKPNPHWRDEIVRDRAHAVDLHAAAIAADSQFQAQIIAELKGRNLACWCRLCDTHRRHGKPFDVACAACLPCHSDTLGRIANSITCEAV